MFEPITSTEAAPRIALAKSRAMSGTRGRYRLDREQGTLGEAKTPLSTVVGGAVKLSSHQECADWSQWQGYYPQTVGLHCVIIQAAYGLREEPSLREQVRDARNHGLPYGVYDRSAWKPSHVSR